MSKGPAVSSLTTHTPPWILEQLGIHRLVVVGGYCVPVNEDFHSHPAVIDWHILETLHHKSQSDI